MRPPCGDGQPCFFTTPGSAMSNAQSARRLGVGDVEHFAVRRQAAAVRAEDRIGHLDDLGAVRQRVVQAAVVARARIALAEIGEIEAAGGVEHQIVRGRQLVAAAMRVEHARVAGLRIDPLDASAGVVVGRADRHPVAARIFAAAVVAAGTARRPGRSRGRSVRRRHCRRSNARRRHRYASHSGRRSRSGSPRRPASPPDLRESRSRSPRSARPPLVVSSIPACSTPSNRSGWPWSSAGAFSVPLRCGTT